MGLLSQASSGGTKQVRNKGRDIRPYVSS